MKHAKFIILLVLILLPGIILAGYSDDLTKGKAAYAAGNYNEALKFYKSAFAENPTTQTGNFIVQLEAMVKKAKDAAEEQAFIDQPPEKAGTGISAGSVLMIIADIGLIGTAIFGYADYNGAADTYDSNYVAKDNTNDANYRALQVEYDQVKSKETFMGVFSSLAGAAAMYTLVDAFFIHAAFPVNVSLDCNLDNARMKVVLNRRF
jgi:hypothetical protein